MKTKCRLHNFMDDRFVFFLNFNRCKRWIFHHLIWLLFLILTGCMNGNYSKEPFLVKASKTYSNIEFGQPEYIERDTMWENLVITCIDSIENKRIKYALREEPKNCYNLEYYSIRWEEDSILYIYGSHRKPLNFRFRKINTISNKEVPYSEYYKRRHIPEKMGGFSKEEIVYYDLHKDSLDLILGENLPPLPKPTRAEKKEWKRVFGK